MTMIDSANDSNVIGKQLFASVEFAGMLYSVQMTKYNYIIIS